MIPFNKPSLSQESVLALKEVIKSDHYSSGGKFNKLATQQLNAVTGINNLLTPSGTHALELGLQVLNLEPGSEIIVPSFTFSSTANAIILSQCVPVFVDVNFEDLNLDLDKIELAITKKTKAILIVHYGGISCDLERLISICDEYDLLLIEDNAHGLGGKFKGQNLGTFGIFSAHSFHETKNIQCGEGGAFSTSDPHLLEKAEIYREKGTDRTKFMEGLIDKYTWKEKGSSLLLPEFLAAILFGQLTVFDAIQRERKKIWDFYHDELSAWAQLNGHKIAKKELSRGSQNPYHLFYIVLNSQTSREKFIHKMKVKGIMTVFHYQPLHNSPAGIKYGKRVGTYETTDYVSQQLVRLPIWMGLSEDQLQFTVKNILKYE